MSERLILVCILSICGHAVAGSQYAAGPELHQELGITQKQFRVTLPPETSPCAMIGNGRYGRNQQEAGNATQAIHSRTDHSEAA